MAHNLNNFAKSAAEFSLLGFFHFYPFFRPIASPQTFPLLLRARGGERTTLDRPTSRRGRGKTKQTEESAKKWIREEGKGKGLGEKNPSFHLRRLLLPEAVLQPSYFFCSVCNFWAFSFFLRFCLLFFPFFLPRSPKSDVAAHLASVFPTAASRSKVWTIRSCWSCCSSIFNATYRGFCRRSFLLFVLNLFPILTPNPLRLYRPRIGNGKRRKRAKRKTEEKSKAFGTTNIGK